MKSGSITLTIEGNNLRTESPTYNSLLALTSYRVFGKGEMGADVAEKHFGYASGSLRVAESPLGKPLCLSIEAAEWLKSAIAKAQTERTEEMYAAEIAQAIATGQPVKLGDTRITNCDRSVRECSQDFISTWIDAYGSISTRRVHAH